MCIQNENRVTSTERKNEKCVFCKLMKSDINACNLRLSTPRILTVFIIYD